MFDLFADKYSYFEHLFKKKALYLPCKSKIIMGKGCIQPCTMEHIGRYAQIYAATFSGEPWNDSWTVEDAEVHVRELLGT